MSGGFNWWAFAATAILGGMESRSQDKTDRRASKEETQEGGYQSRLSAAYDAQLRDWERRRVNEERRGGLSNYAQFSDLEGYEDVWTPAPSGDMPAPYGPEGMPPSSNTAPLSIEEQMRQRQLQGSRQGGRFGNGG